MGYVGRSRRIGSDVWRLPTERRSSATALQQIEVNLDI